MAARPAASELSSSSKASLAVSASSRSGHDCSSASSASSISGAISGFGLFIGGECNECSPDERQRNPGTIDWLKCGPGCRFAHPGYGSDIETLLTISTWRYLPIQYCLT